MGEENNLQHTLGFGINTAMVAGAFFLYLASSCWFYRQARQEAVIIEKIKDSLERTLEHANIFCNALYDGLTPSERKALEQQIEKRKAASWAR
jgi:hypothetical protein